MNQPTSQQSGQYLEHSKQVFRRSAIDAFWRILFGAILIVISMAMFQTLGESNTLIASVVGLYGLWCALQGLYIACDQSVQIGLDEQGIHSPQLQHNLIKWGDLQATNVYAKTTGIRTTHHVRLITHAGLQQDLELSNLDGSVGNIIIAMDQFMKQAATASAVQSE